MAAHSIEERVEQIIREEVAPPVEEVHPPRLRAAEAPTDRSQGAQSPATEETEAAKPKPATENDGPPVEAPGSQAGPTPKPPASEKSTTRKFRLARFFLAGVGLVAAAVWILSMRTPVPKQQGASQVAPAPEAQPAASDAQNPAQGSVAETTGATPEQPLTMEGSVTDQATGRAIPRARIYYAGQSLTTDDLGKFNLTAVKGESRFFVKASGYRQTEAAIESKQPIRLKPIEIRAFYLSHAHVADKARRESILGLIRESSANAVVLGVKDVTGQVNVSVDSKLASEIDATSKASSVDLARQVAVWKSEGIYTIGLLTLFKDDLVARRKPKFALRSLQSHQVIKDPDGISWVNPAIAEVRDYNIAVAKAAAATGFDEIQFDFTRYPAEPLSQEGGGPVEYQRRLETIVDFLRRANSALGPYNVYVGSSVFGSVCTLPRAGVIGQKIEEFAEQLDYISPMLYPSYFEPGAKYPIPLRHGYQLVYDNLLRAVNRLHGDNRRLRPWLQNFPDRSSPNVPLNVDEIHGQIKAVVDARASGWMLWDARNVYLNSSAAVQRLNSKSTESKVKTQTITGGALIGTSGLDFPPPPSGGTGEKLGVVGLLLLTGFCLAVLYGAARAAWLFRKWTRHGPAMPRTVAAATSRGRRRLARPEWFAGFPQARPR